LIHLIVLNIEY